MVTIKNIGLIFVHSHLTSHAFLLQGTPSYSSNDEGAIGGGEPNASPPLKPNMPINAPDCNNDEVELGIQMERYFAMLGGHVMEFIMNP